MKILILTQFLNTGGLERLVYSLSTGLSNSNSLFEPTVVYYDNNPGKPVLRDVLRSKGIPVLEFQKGKGFSLKLVWKIFRFANKNHIKLIHTHDLGPLIYGSLVKILSLGSIRIIHTQHGSLYLSDSPKYRVYEYLFHFFVNHFV